MMEQIFLREINAEERKDFAQVIRASFLTVADEFGLTRENCPTNGAFLTEERLGADMEKGNAMFGLFADRQPIGFVQLRDKGEGVFEMEKLCVLPERRHGKSGTMLLEKAKAEAIRRGGRKITIGIIEENLQLKNWYLSKGFVHTGTIDLPHLPFIVGFMELSLDNSVHGS